jgi:GNAT superfamily N-acetyltransferase
VVGRVVEEPNGAGGLVVRARATADVPALVGLMREVHERDRYPVQWPDDPAGFLDPVDGLAAWVVDISSTVVGHVMLTEPDPAVATVLGVSGGEVVVVSRLFVASSARGHGVGARLLAAAVEAGRALECGLALEVLSLNADAIAFYERSGWTPAGSRPARAPRAPAGTMALLYRAPSAA